MIWHEKRWPSFKKEEFACRHCGQCHMDEGFLDKMQLVRDTIGIPMIVSSGFRCPEYNVQVSSTGEDGPHTTGHAADIRISGQNAFKLVKAAAIIGMTGIGVAQKGAFHSRFIHLDDLPNSVRTPRPWVWSY